MQQARSARVLIQPKAERALKGAIEDAGQSSDDSGEGSSGDSDSSARSRERKLKQELEAYLHNEDDEEEAEGLNLDQFVRAMLKILTKDADDRGGPGGQHPSRGSMFGR